MSQRPTRLHPPACAPRRRRSPVLEGLEDRRLMTGGFDIYPLTTGAVVTSSGGFYQQLTLPAIVSGSDGNLWFADGSNGVGRITPAGVVTVFPVSTGSSSSSTVGGVTLGKDGNIWFTDGNSLGSITPTGTISLVTIPGGHDGSAITTDPSGNLWFVNETGNVEEYSTAGVFSTVTLPNASTNFAPNWSIAATSDGAIWVSEYPSFSNTVGNVQTTGVNGVVDRIDPSGAVTTTVISTSYDTRIGLTAGPNGNVWFADQATETVGSITPTGTVTSYAVEGRPSSITTGSDGALWFTVPYAYPNTTIDGLAIGRVTTSGSVSYYSIPRSDLEDNLDAITTGPDGAVWFTADNSEQDAIGRLDPGVAANAPGTDVPVVVHPAQSALAPPPIVVPPVVSKPVKPPTVHKVPTPAKTVIKPPTAAQIFAKAILRTARGSAMAIVQNARLAAERRIS